MAARAHQRPGATSQEGGSMRRYLTAEAALWGAKDRTRDAARWAGNTTAAIRWQALMAITDAEGLLDEARRRISADLTTRGIDLLTGCSVTRRLLSSDGDDLGLATPEQCVASDADGSATGMITVWWPTGDVPVPGETYHGEAGQRDVYVVSASARKQQGGTA